MASPLQVQQVRQALLRDYAGRIYDEDLKGYDARGREQRFLSRALTAAAVRMVTGCDHEAAGRAVIDGERDQGIDGVAVSESSQDVWLVQAKWSDDGKGKLDTNAVHKLIAGFRLIEQRNFDRFNDRLGDPIAARVNAALGDARLKITLVIAVMGPGLLSDEVTAALEDVCDDFNGALGPVLGYRVVHAADFHKQLRDDLAPEPVNVTARMANWIKRDVPFEAWQGTVAASDIARWHAVHESGLYEENVRNSLGLTRINSGIKTTLLTEPENFWYFNNGITVLCDTIKPTWPGRRRPDEPVDLLLEGMSVVNGAQTVTSIYEAMRQNPESVEDADVTVRVFSLGAERAAYATRITETTNTQNDVSQRDFIALDTTQALIREEFRLSLGKTYVFKRGEPDPSPDAGCSVVHAATALACAYRTPELAVRAKSDTDLLWERGTGGAYPRLFGEAPGAVEIWRTVLVYWAVGAALERQRKRLHGRAADMASRGDLLVTHLVFQLIDREQIDDSSIDWQAVLDQVPDLTASVLSWLIYHVDAEYGKSSFLNKTFGDESRCKLLAQRVLADARRGGTVPVLADDYRPPAKRGRQPRRPNAVPTLVNSGRLANGLPLRFLPKSDAERTAVAGWLAEDPRRGRATWINDRVRCLLWEYDGGAYSASGLVTRIWELAGYDNAPVAVQGPSRWTADGQKTLWDLALEVLEDGGEEEEN
ncbi:AIPR family protein [Streptomyces sp. 8K308]|uniref:AIPR family protein n=1 Tax=Streptomyces sp. 8K308 TaxID=2530388 RepID=UPI001FB71386|nr:AIPR family protein [Streptomyces sp. 8K308]